MSRQSLLFAISLLSEFQMFVSIFVYSQLFYLFAELRKEANESFSAHRLLNNSNSNSNVSFLSSTADKEKALQEAEKVRYFLIVFDCR